MYAGWAAPNSVSSSDSELRVMTSTASATDRPFAKPCIHLLLDAFSSDIWLSTFSSQVTGFQAEAKVVILAGPQLRVSEKHSQLLAYLSEMSIV